MELSCNSFCQLQAKALIEKDTDSRVCIGGMDGFLVLFDSAVMRATNSASESSNNFMTESQSASAINSS